jgi:hypothetical protein
VIDERQIENRPGEVRIYMVIVPLFVRMAITETSRQHNGQGIGRFRLARLTHRVVKPARVNQWLGGRPRIDERLRSDRLMKIKIEAVALLQLGALPTKAAASRIGNRRAEQLRRIVEPILQVDRDRR